jgi:ATP-dependent Clp protease protease subunit
MIKKKKNKIQEKKQLNVQSQKNNKNIKNIELLKNIKNTIYTNKFNHIYLYGIINNSSILKIKEQVDYYNKTQKTENNINIKPKSIILHINSPGGYVTSGIGLTRLINNSNVPIIILIEGLSASAATLISVMSPYRIMTQNSIMLIHQYSALYKGQRDSLEFDLKEGDLIMKNMYKIYLKYTKIKENEIKELLTHDLYFTAEKCLKYGMCDYILPDYNNNLLLNYLKKNPEYNFSKNIINKKTNFNELYFYGSNEINMFVKSSNYILNLHNIYYKNNDNENNTNELSLNSIGNPKPIIIHINDSGDFQEIIGILPIINTISVSKIPIFSIIEAPIDITSLLYSIICHKRYIYEYAFISIDMVNYFYDQSHKYNDIIENTKIIRSIILKLLLKYTKLPKNIIDNIFTKRYIFNVEESIKYGLCDEIIS